MTDYPPDFPPAAQLKVENEKDRQSRKLMRRMQKTEPHPRGMWRVYYGQPRWLGKHYWPGKLEDLPIICILAVWRVFVSENTKRCPWPRSKDWEWQAMDVLRQLVYEFYGKGEFGWPMHLTVNNPQDIGRIADRVIKQQIPGSKTWQYLLKELAESAATKAPAVPVPVSAEQVSSTEAGVKQSPPVKRRKRRKRKPATKVSAPEESAKTPDDEPSYDPVNQICKLCGKTYLKISQRQFDGVKRVYDTAVAGGAGVHLKGLAPLVGLNEGRGVRKAPVRLRNAYQRGDALKLYKAAYFYDRRSDLYCFKPSVKPRPS